MKENWKDINDYEGQYQVSNFGNVKSLRRKDTFKSGRWKRERILKPNMTKWGYLKVGLCKKGTVSTKSIHKLVANTFVLNPRLLSEVNHKDGCKTNNRSDNLEWCTHAENQKHAIEKELYRVGENHPSAKLKESQVEEIRESVNITQRQLAKKYGVSQRTIAQIIHNEIWKK